MSSTLYLKRTLSSDSKTYTEEELISSSRYVVVLAEPGGGKTELLHSLAQQLGTRVLTASKFRYSEARSEGLPLVLDAFDELAKVDASGIFQLLARAESTNPTYVYLSSRSSEWGNASTAAFRDFLGHVPLVVRLCAFEESEQRAIFEDHARGEDFIDFQAEVARFDLEALLPNPQFLKLFADAYIQSGRHFTNKRSIFAQAVERLAREVNVAVARANSTLSAAQRVNLSSEVFAKILLSGVEGVCTSEAAEDRMYPLLAPLVNGSMAADGILATRLFKPTERTDQHRPVHKIVTEYCAADYLCKRIVDPADPLTWAKCMPIIAPNSIVRDELRGLLGWMASLGNKSIEQAAIELDPYAVLANGDPSQLEQSSKRLLIGRLKDIEARDPYFRRGDLWRRFSVAGFFTRDVVDEIRPLLATGRDGHLRDLILELLVDSPIVDQLTTELRQLALASSESKTSRMLASRCLVAIVDHDHLADVSALIAEATHSSLNVAAETIAALGHGAFTRRHLADCFRASAGLYPIDHNHRERTIGERYFLKYSVDGLDLASVQWLLDELTAGLSCTCEKKSHECGCRNGISKIVGRLLDRYFELAAPPFEATRIWKWVKDLRFHEQRSPDQSKAVQVLQNDHGLRQEIISHVFGTLTDRDHIFENKIHRFDWHSHSGLNFQTGDYRFIIDLAYQTDNPTLWSSFMARHQYHRSKENRGEDILRRHMREQASSKRSFMREWARSNREAARFERSHRVPNFRHARRMRRRRTKQDDIRAANIKYVQENREIIEGGRHWGFLYRFSEITLMSPNSIEKEFGDEFLVRNALRNCLDFLTPYVPDLPGIAKLRCASQFHQAETVLYAACLEILRSKGNLEGLDNRLLRSLRTNIRTHYSGVPKEDAMALKREVDRLAFPDEASRESFLREYVEPQLASPECPHPDVWLLRGDETFSSFRAALSIEWLQRFRGLALGSLDTLFDVAAQHGNREDLKAIIAERCAEFSTVSTIGGEVEGIDPELAFWLVRAFYFLNDPPDECWRWLKHDEDTVHLLYERFGRMSSNDHPYWPRLTPRKVEAILDVFVEKWPKVDLPSHWGTGSPRGENAYRFLTEVIWVMVDDDHDDAVLVADRLLADLRFAHLHKDLKSIRAGHVKKRALKNFEPPTPEQIVDRLDRDAVVTVEGLRQLVIEELDHFQKAIKGGEYNSADLFYEKGSRLDEERCTEIIAERLSLRLQTQNIVVTPEHQLKASKRSDFTIAKLIGGRRRLLVAEVKGQWHRELYTAASIQLYERYAIHPDAEQQGIYLVIWFGADEKVAGRKNHGIGSAFELKRRIESSLPPELTGQIDIFVLDVSKVR
ncbi:hypothetical protein QFZ41_002151 [Luteibacter sp. W1I16]|uniref:hypothetical protein n=1 Tax=Luteibacter sp. W1I16 TaxID=3373922 RepID=UPI003D1D8F95